VESIDPAESRAAACQQLAEIREDPRIQRLALRRVGHAALADDALQSTYYALARLENLEQIQDLRAYFCKVLIREIYRERGQLGATLVDDFARVADAYRDAVGCNPASPPAVDDEVCTSLQGQVWLDRFAAQGDRLQAEVSARSADPARYRTVICAAAGYVLRDGINGETSQADSNPALRAAYTDYFAQPGASANLLHQRFRRAREDVKVLLQAVVSRDELT
jgi:DNA-directed RNA polymerase specialized sigma24 family protein